MQPIVDLLIRNIFMILIMSKLIYSDIGKPNILFISCDDLNDWVGFLGGHPNTLTPNMDRLAKRSMVFERAYCASPICGPSRASVLTGLKPENSGVYNNIGTYVEYVPKVKSLPRYFKDRGYVVMGAGKINHSMGVVDKNNYHEYGPDAGAIGGPFTWEELNMNPGNKVERDDIAGKRMTMENGIIQNIYPGKVIARGRLKAILPLNGIDNRIDRPENGYNTFDWGEVDVSDNDMPDGQMAEWAEDKLKSHFKSPFFLAVGFYRPHQPWYAPKKYFEPFKNVDLPLPVMKENDLQDCSVSARQYAHYPWSGSYETVKQNDQHKEAIRGYLASVHFVDAQVGRLLDALDASSYSDNTIVVFWSDHGWELGEKEHWGKHSPWEGSMRVPLMISLPKKWSVPSGRTSTFASLLDLYPTLPSHLDGLSLVPVLRKTKLDVRSFLTTSLGRSSFCIYKDNLKLIRYYDGNEELYDLEKDPHEFNNLMNHKGYKDKINKLRKLAPLDDRYKAFVRYGRYKATIDKSDQIRIYDMLHPKSGIGEQFEVTDSEPHLLNEIKDFLKNQNIKDRYFTMERQ